MGPGSRIEIHQDRHNSNLQRITIQMKLLKRNYFFLDPLSFRHAHVSLITMFVVFRLSPQFYAEKVHIYTCKGETISIF